MAGPAAPPAEAAAALLILTLALLAVILIFCILPVYRLLHHRWSHWEERDPRWNSDTFQFASSSGRAARPGAGKTDRTREASPPPAYTDLFTVEAGVTSGDPPPYSSRPSSRARSPAA